MRRVTTPHSILVLQHPRAARAPFGTVRILQQALPRVTVRVGTDFTHDDCVRAALSEPLHQPIVLFPRKNAKPLQQFAGERPLTLIVVDGTWTLANSIVRKNRWLDKLASYRVATPRLSIFRLPSQPSVEHVSTLEAVAEALTLLQDNSQIHEILTTALRAMIGLQLACIDVRSSAILGHRSLLVRAGYLPTLP